MKRLFIIFLGVFIIGIVIGVKFSPIFREKQTTSIEKRSKSPGVIADIILAKTIDATTGKPLTITHAFSKKEPTIYAVMKLQHVSSGTRIEYVRYRNKKYLDHRSIQIVQPVLYVNFHWKLKTPPADRPAGTYLIKVYANGKLEKAAEYVVREALDSASFTPSILKI